MGTRAQHLTVTPKAAPGNVVAENRDDAALIAAPRTGCPGGRRQLDAQYDGAGPPP
ncbi:hypothetical protein [Streptomyces sp. NPDC052042]|uniref:hypothetical protein n=1 Tax=Streptomyces sp. NPDC052042 TaxID=3365683 RepID=UPI0037CDC324